jgi:hypothetical protein
MVSTPSSDDTSSLSGFGAAATTPKPAQEDKSPMHNDKRSYSIPYERVRRLEAAVLALVLAEDWPWQTDELAVRLHVPTDLIGLVATTLRADGLLVMDGESLRASWAAVRGDELAAWHDSNKRRAHMPVREAAIPTY